MPRTVVATFIALATLRATSTLSAQAPAAGPVGARAAELRGVVFDSIARAPLSGALVQLVSADSTVNFGRTEPSNAAGAFAFTDVPDGRYTIGFFHPMLDSLGIDPSLRAVTISGGRAARVDLAIPGPARLRRAICGTRAGANANASTNSNAHAPDGAVIMGFVRDARGRAPAPGVTVTAQWIELSIGRGGISRSIPKRAVTTRESGWFAVCDAPSPGTVVLAAHRGSDSTDVVEVDVPSDGFVRRELYLGAARSIVVNAGATDAGAGVTALAAADSAAPPRRIHVGDGVLRGRVVTALGNQPLAGALVGIVNGPQARSNERGEWIITDAPSGTRSLETRAVGYYPVRQTVDVIDSAAPLRVAMVTFKSVLDTMKVVANYNRYTKLAEFQERRKSGMGRFLTSEDILRRQPVVTTELFRNVPGVYVERSSNGGDVLSMRGIFADRCSPAIYVDGSLMGAMSASDIDDFLGPKDIAGVEIYTESQAPPPFQSGMSGCGAIVFWTK